MPPLDCGHQTAGEVYRVCQHLLDVPEHDYVRRFTGRGLAFDVVCPTCWQALADEGRRSSVEDNLRTVCRSCWDRVLEGRSCAGFHGQPEALARPSSLWFEHETVGGFAALAGSILDVQPLDQEDRNAWLALVRSGELLALDLDTGRMDGLVQVPAAAVDLAQAVSLHLSRDGSLAAVVNTRGRAGVVVDLQSGHVTMNLQRDDYHNEHCTFAVAFFEADDRTLLVSQTGWNRLDISDPRTAECLTPRTHPPTEGGARPEHYLDYFHCGLSVSPDQEHVADNGWVWHPCGAVVTWSLTRWLNENVWESEDGPTRRSLCWRTYFWDGPVCWIDNRHLAVWGYGDDEETLIPAALIFDVTTGKQVRWFAGPKGSLVFDEYLFASDSQEGTSVWDVQTGERLLHDPFCPLRYHRGAKCFVTTRPDGSFVVSRLRGQPVDPAWLSWDGGALTRIAGAIAADKTFDHLPVLADALEEAGCQDSVLLGHCRNPGPHGGRCWAVDRLLGKNERA